MRNLKYNLCKIKIGDVMLFSEINPFVRYARYMKVSAEYLQSDKIAYDARFFYVKSGSGAIVANEREYTLHTGSVLLVNAGVKYRYCWFSPDSEYIIFNFDYTRVASHLVSPIPPVSPENFIPANINENCRFDDVPSFDTVAFFSHFNNLESYLSTIVEEYNRRLIHNTSVTGALLSFCLAMCARRELGGVAQREKVSDKIIAYIHQNYNFPLTNIGIGDKFGYHPNYISTLIKTNTGMPLHKYLIHIRLNRAVEMLENGSMSISEIARECGFCDTAYFSGYFKKHFGISPTGYKGL